MRLLLLACAETRVLALFSPAIELCFCFRIGAVFYTAKKCASRRAARCKNMLSSAFRIVFFLCFPVCLAFRIGFAVFLPTLDFLEKGTISGPGLLRASTGPLAFTGCAGPTSPAGSAGPARALRALRALRAPRRDERPVRHKSREQTGGKSRTGAGRSRST